MRYILVSLLCLPLTAQAVYYCVSSNGAASSANCQGSEDNCSGKTGASACALATANGAVAAGDTVYLQAGTYGSGSTVQIRPGTNGTSGSPITYEAYGDGTVTLTSVGNTSGADQLNAGAVALGDRDYIHVLGHDYTIVVDPGNAAYSALGNLNSANWNIIDGVYFDGSGQTSGGNFVFAINHRFTRVTGDAEYNIIRNCYFTGLAGEGSYTEDGVMFGDGAYYNLFENNETEQVRHIPLNLASDSTDGSMPHDNVIRNNIVSNTYHTAMGLYGAGDSNVIEGNIIRSSGDYAESPAGTGNGIQISADYTIIRYNDISKAGNTDTTDVKTGGISFVINGGTGNEGEDTAVSNAIYNNTLVDNAAPTITVVNPAGGTITIENNRYINNLLYDSDSLMVNYRYLIGDDPADQWTKNMIGDYNGGAAPNPSTAIIWLTLDGSNQTVTPATAVSDAANPEEPQWDSIVQPLPNFVNYASADYHLNSTSALIDAGVELTTVATADTGTGTSLIVNNARPFQDGKGIPDVQADWISVGTVSNTVQISSINYSTNTITLANTTSRSDNDPIWLYKLSDGTRVLYGSAPDIGAYEYIPASKPSARGITPGVRPGVRSGVR